MKQLNNCTLKNPENDREPNWCVFCDTGDRCSRCDATDIGEADCGSCDSTTECACGSG